MAFSTPSDDLHPGAPLTLSGYALVMQGIYDQSGSPLFAKLPTELREMIWKECVGGHMIHLSHAKAFLCHIPESRGLGGHDACYDSREALGPIVFPFLLTCRRICYEALPLLFSANTFRIAFCDTMVNTIAKRSPRLTNSITQLYFCWTPLHGPPFFDGLSIGPGKTKRWLRTWEALSKMEGLHYLRVDLRLSRPAKDVMDWSQAEDVVLKPVKEVRVKKRLELYLPWPANPKGVIAKELPCTIMRTYAVEN